MIIRVVVMKAHIISDYLRSTMFYVHNSIPIKVLRTYNDYKTFIHGYLWTELNGRNKLMESVDIHKSEYITNKEEALNYEPYFF